MRLLILLLFAIVWTAGAQVPVVSVADVKSAHVHYSTPIITQQPNQIAVVTRVEIVEVRYFAPTNVVTPTYTPICNSFYVYRRLKKPPGFATLPYQNLSLNLFNIPAATASWQDNPCQLTSILWPQSIRKK